MREETKLIRAIQWKKIIDEQLASGLNQTAWCQVNNISRNTFKNWKSRLTEYTLQEDDRYPEKEDGRVQACQGFP